jgi:hypothetical protein
MITLIIIKLIIIIFGKYCAQSKFPKKKYLVKKKSLSASIVRKTIESSIIDADKYFFFY